MKELENGKKKLLITGMILIIIAVCAAGIFAYGSHKNNQKAAAKVQEESVQRASQEQSLAAQKEQDGIWNTNIFGKSIEQIVEDGMNAKINQMTDSCQQKLQDALKKIINDSNGGIVCIII